MGEQIKGLKYPVCNSFKPKVLKDQLCYQVDVNDIKRILVDETDIQHEVIFLLDYNEEKMLIAQKDLEIEVPTTLHEMQDNDDNELGAIIYIETLGRMHNSTF